MSNTILRQVVSGRCKATTTVVLIRVAILGTIVAIRSECSFELLEAQHNRGRMMY
jgi:hypothetical protein